MDRWLAKLISLVLVFLLPFIFTVLPHHMMGCMERHGRRGQRILCLLMCFGGGIFLATYLLHMGPEVRDILDDALLAPNDITYPLPDFIIGCGFFFVLFIEKVVMRFNKRRTQKRQLDRESCNSASNDNAVYSADIEDNVHAIVNSDGVDKARTTTGIVTTNGFVAAQATGDVVLEAGSNSKSNGMRSGQVHIGGESQTDGGAGDDGGHRAMRSLILILALSLHHLFEGISLGLQRSVTGVFMLLIALLCHETIISFSLGLQFVKCSYTMRQHYITAFVCSIVEPIGIAAGMVMSEVSRPTTAMGVVDGVLQAFATGTFIYVTFFEILQEEIDPHDTSVGKVTSALAGFIVMSALMMVPVDTSEDDVHHVLSNYTTVPPHAI